MIDYIKLIARLNMLYMAVQPLDATSGEEIARIVRYLTKHWHLEVSQNATNAAAIFYEQNLKDQYLATIRDRDDEDSARAFARYLVEQSTKEQFAQGTWDDVLREALFLVQEETAESGEELADLSIDLESE